MEESKKYYLFVNRKKVLVSEAVYVAHLQMKDHEEYLERKDRLKGKVLYSNMDSDEMTGEESIPDQNAVRIDDLVTDMLMVEQLHTCIKLLAKAERELIAALYFDGYSEREWSEKTGIPNMTIHDRKIKILAKLKKLMEK